MPTRGVVGFLSGGRWFVSYNHMDSYPAWLGKDVLALCRELALRDVGELREILSRVEIVSHTSPASPESVEKYKNFFCTGVGSGRIDDWYCLLRTIQGADFLRELASGFLTHCPDYSQFMDDGLDCEWGYIINLDKKTPHLMVYKGGRTATLAKNILPPNVPNVVREGYAPVTIICTYRLDFLPDSLESLDK